MTDTHGVARDQLRAFIERIERLEEEKKTIADDIKDVYGEAKAMGYETKIMKKVIALRKMDDTKRTEEELVLDTYLQALGMIPQFEMFEQDEVKPSREERCRQRTTDAMDDHKSLVEEMADAGLISEEARHENKVLADAVASKFSNGPAMALQSPRQAADAVSERTEINQPETADELQHPESHASGATAETHARSGGDDGMVRSARTEADAVTDRRDDHLNSPSDDDAIAAVKGKARLANVADVDPSSSAPIDPTEDREEAQSQDAESADANTGGDNVEASEPFAAPAGVLVRAPATFTLRPDCLKPENCAGYGSTHCHSCKKEALGREAA